MEINSRQIHIKLFLTKAGLAVTDTSSVVDYLLCDHCLLEFSESVYS